MPVSLPEALEGSQPDAAVSDYRVKARLEHLAWCVTCPACEAS